MDRRHVLTLSCGDAVGIVAAVTGLLAARNWFIVESQQYADLAAGRFFARVEFTGAGAIDDLRAAFAPVAVRFGMEWRLRDAGRRPRAMVLVSRLGHCLNDLLHRWRTDTLPVEIALVASNHEDLRGITEWHGVPFAHVPVTPGTKAEAEAALQALAGEHRIDLFVLARYMQVLSAGLCAQWAGRVINIHHSFLPSFKGARPYHRAHAHGVKLIGATAHFVTADLDEGPIIEQATERVEHWHSADDLVRIGRDVEAMVLARAVGWVAQDRVLANGARTVVFRH